jgi:hypothetical protein
MPIDAMFMDDPPDVNCRAKSYSAADHLINARAWILSETPVKQQCAS